MAVRLALDASRDEAQKFANKYPDGGWSMDNVVRFENAIKEFSKATKNYPYNHV